MKKILCLILFTLVYLNVHAATPTPTPTPTPKATPTPSIKMKDVEPKKFKLTEKNGIKAVGTPDTNGTIYVYTRITDTAKVKKITDELVFPFGYGLYGIGALKTKDDDVNAPNVEVRP